MKERRKQFLINRPLQLRYMAYIALPFLAIALITILSLYIGIWGGVLDAFSDEKIRNDLLMASRLTEYEEARIPPTRIEIPSSLSFFKQSEKLSRRQREIFREILDDANKKLITKFFMLLFFIAWGSIYISHKIAGPLYRFHATLGGIEEGDFRTRVKLRRFDEAQFLAIRFNRVLESLDYLFGRLKNIIRENETQTARMTTRLKEELSKIKTSADR